MRRKRNINHGTKRAGIYVRVSTEEQSVKNGKEMASPVIQEKEVREKLEALGYTVTQVYKDTERYRVRGRLVEPSGTRSDRPSFLRMLKDIDEGKLDAIGCWRVDRLYRGITAAFVELQERVESDRVEVVSVKDTFDPITAGFLAAAARVELQAKHDRMMMGVAGRLRAGKPWNSPPPYGYRLSKGTYAEEPAEVEAIRLIYRWYADGLPTREIARRLIRQHIPQRSGEIRQPWKLVFIRRILNRDCYHTGTFEWQWGGESYHIPIPRIIDESTAQRVKDRRRKYKGYPAGHLKRPGLASGLVHCSGCGVKMHTITRTVKGSHHYSCYVCWRLKEVATSPGCARTVSTEKIDTELWSRLWSLLSDPDRFQALLAEKIAEQKRQERTTQADVDRLEAALSRTEEQRQRLVDLASRAVLTDTDIAAKVKALNYQRDELERQLGHKRRLLGGPERSREIAQLVHYLFEEIKATMPVIRIEPDYQKVGDLISKDERRKLVERFVRRVDVGADKSIEVHTIFELPNALPLAK